MPTGASLGLHTGKITAESGNSSQDIYFDITVYSGNQGCNSSYTLINFYRDWLEKYDIIYLEDGLHPQDISGWESLTNQMHNAMIVAGNHLFDNKINELRKSLKQHLANAVVIQLSKFNTILDCIEFIKLAQKHNYLTILNTDYGATNDSFLADLAIAVNIDYFKAGSLSRGERVGQYNRLLEIAFGLNS